jgi:hypothetical protein
MSDRQRALLAALEELRMADRILASIEAAPRSGGQRAWETFTRIKLWMHAPWGDWQFNDRTVYTSNDARAVNTELFEAQAAIARARALVGLPGDALVEIPVEMEQMQSLSEHGKIWTLCDDVELVRQLRERTRWLFACLHGEDPAVRDHVTPLDDELY